jgi:hypothetical protein
MHEPLCTGCSRVMASWMDSYSCLFCRMCKAHADGGLIYYFLCVRVLSCGLIVPPVSVDSYYMEVHTCHCYLYVAG